MAIEASVLCSPHFEHNFLTKYEDGKYKYIGEGDPATLVDEVETNFNASSLEDTDSPFDMAIAGEGYFNIRGENRQYMTRNGNFNIDEEGYLVLDGVGKKSWGESGDLLIGGSDFTVTKEGYVFDANNQYLDKLLITRVAEGSELKNIQTECSVRTGQILLTIRILSETLERSNVDMNQEYTRLIEAQRNLQACATALSTVDAMNAKAATLSSIA